MKATVLGAPVHRVFLVICVVTVSILASCQTQAAPALDHASSPQVLVIRLQTAGSVEERVVDVAQSKRMFVDRSITCAWKNVG